MRIFGLEINRRSNEVNEPVVPSEPSAISTIFQGFKLDGASTSLSPFFAATELISNSVAQLPILVKRKNDIDFNHPLNYLFKDALISKYNFMKMLIADVILHGNGYAYIERAGDGTPINLIYCEYGSVVVNYNKQKQEIFYQIPFIKRGKIEQIDVIHLYKNSNDGVNGIPLANYANQVLKLAQATDKSASKYYSSGCALQGALTIKGTRKGSKEQARQAFAETHGDKGSGLVILDDDMSYTPISSNANDSQMIEARTFNVREVARYFNLNPILLGDNSGASFSTIEAANIEFVSHTLQPYITMVEDEFNRKLVKPSERDSILIDIDEKYFLKGDMNTTASYLSTLTSSGIMSINEARQHLGLKPVEGGDECAIPYTKIEDNKINNSNNDGEQRTE
jgi:HK97 family phage portal protein